VNTIDVYELDEIRPWTEEEADAQLLLAPLDADREVDFDDDRRDEQ
jgi:hypothetical protein